MQGLSEVRSLSCIGDRKATQQCIAPRRFVELYGRGMVAVMSVSRRPPYQYPISEWPIAAVSTR